MVSRYNFATIENLPTIIAVLQPLSALHRATIAVQGTTHQVGGRKAFEQIGVHARLDLPF